MLRTGLLGRGEGAAAPLRGGADPRRNFEALREGISLCLEEEPAGPLQRASVTFVDRPLTTA
jgi:hypothetical protein